MNPLLRRLDATIHRTTWPLTAAARTFTAEYRRLRQEQADLRKDRP